MKKTFLFALLLAAALLVRPATVIAGTLDLAIIQLNGLAEIEEINDALRGENLASAAFGDRFQVKNARLRGTPVLFSQTLGVTPGRPFGSSTRIGGQRAEVEGKLGSNDLQARIVLSEGMEANLRRFSQSVYQGNGPLVPGAPRVLGLRQVDLRQPSTVKGRAKMTTTQLSVVLLYQYRR
jgi:hypothetical protein